jgi:hypothetical protein
MNSLPSISHHLFVAAISNEGRPQERPIRDLQLAGGAAALATALALEAMESRRPIPVGRIRLLRTPLVRARG